MEIPARGEFNGAGWLQIAVCFVMYFAYAGWTVDGLNIIVPTLAGLKGWQPGQLLNLAGIGGLFSVVGSAFFGHMIMRYGARWVMSGCLLMMAPSLWWFGHVQALWECALVFVAFNFFGAGFGYIAPGALLTRWFPRNKGLALAIATCGFPVATAAFIPLIAALFATVGLTRATEIWAMAMALASLIAWLAIRNDRPERGHSSAATHAGEQGAGARHLPFRQILRERRLWVISAAWGGLWLVTVGIVVQLVPRLVELGYRQYEAIGLLSTAALIAIPGSLLWGYLDHRIGTRQASAAYAVHYIGTLILLIIAGTHPTFVFPCVVLVGIGLGGIKSLITSMVATAYGQAGFASAFRVVMPLSIIVRTLCFPIMGMAISTFGTLTAAYYVFIAVDMAALALILTMSTTQQQGKQVHEQQ